MVDRNIQVIIIDDEKAFLNVLIKRLVKRGIQATGVDNGQKGILLFQIRPVDIVILDVCMPGIDGIQTLKTIKKLQPLTQVILGYRVDDAWRDIIGVSLVCWYLDDLRWEIPVAEGMRGYLFDADGNAVPTLVKPAVRPKKGVMRGTSG